MKWLLGSLLDHPAMCDRMCGSSCGHRGRSISSVSRHLVDPVEADGLLSSQHVGMAHASPPSVMRAKGVPILRCTRQAELQRLCPRGRSINSVSRHLVDPVEADGLQGSQHVGKTHASPPSVMRTKRLLSPENAPQRDTGQHRRETLGPVGKRAPLTRGYGLILGKLESHLPRPC